MENISKDAIQALNSNDVLSQLLAVQEIRQHIEKLPTPLYIEELVKLNIIPRIIHLLAKSNPEIQLEASNILINVTGGTSKQTHTVVEHGSIEILVDLLETSPHPEIVENATWVLGNIAVDSAQNRNRVLQAGIVKPLLRHLSTSLRPEMHRNGIWTIARLCSKLPPPSFHFIADCLPFLASFLYYLDEEVVGEACRGLSCLCRPRSQIQAVIDAGVVPRLVELME
jgi:hypothetical protein